MAGCGAQVEALLPKDLSKLAAQMPPELAALLAHPETLDPVKIPAGGSVADRSGLCISKVVKFHTFQLHSLDRSPIDGAKILVGRLF